MHKSPPSSGEMGASELSHEQQNGSSPPALVGTKRKASFPFSESASKRTHTESGLDHLGQANTPPVHHCPICHRPCWFCQSSSASQEVAVLFSQHEFPAEVMPDGKASTTATSEMSKASEASKASQDSRDNKKKRKRDDGRIYVTAKDPAFAEKVLLPCKVRVRYTSEDNVDADVCFGKQPEIASSNARLSFDETELRTIARDFMQYERRGDDENALVLNYAQRFLVNEHVQDPEDPVRTVLFRKDKWKPHKPGPVLSSVLYYYDWDVEPDVTYTVSINQFELRDRDVLKTPPMDQWLAEKEACCPYLTIEYKCGAKTGKRIHAVHQNTAASVIWLEQRQRMRRELSRDTRDLRHYSIILMDGNFEVWEARCQKEGYVVQILAMGNLKKIRDLKEYVRWSNAIHTWGLGANALSFKKDIMELLRRSEEAPALTPTSLEMNAKLAEAAASSASEQTNSVTSASPPHACPEASTET